MEESDTAGHSGNVSGSITPVTYPSTSNHLWRLNGMVCGAVVAYASVLLCAITGCTIGAKGEPALSNVWNHSTFECLAGLDRPQPPL